MSQLVCSGVSLGYDGKIFAENVSFAVEAGDYLCVTGENGAGKSTLIKAILGLKEPVSGKISFDEDLRYSDIGYLPQQTAVQRDFPASVYEIVISGFTGRCGFRPCFTRSERAEAERNMKKLGIFELKKRCYRELSGGQQQRVLLARALCAAKKMILLDEPAAGLDPSAMLEMYSCIDRLNREDGITVVMVSHDIAASLKYAKHILHLGNPNVFFGTVEEYVKSDAGGVFRNLREEADK